MKAETKQFIESLKTIQWFEADGRPDSEWKLFGSMDAAWDAARGDVRGDAWNAARDAIREAAWNAAWNATGRAAWNTAWNAAGYAAWDAAWDAAWATARVTARATARDIARVGAWGAAFDAAFDAALLAIVIESGITGKHAAHARDRMRVWQKGYCLLCDANGRLYVYAVKKEGDE